MFCFKWAQQAVDTTARTKQGSAKRASGPSRLPCFVRTAAPWGASQSDPADRPLGQFSPLACLARVVRERGPSGPRPRKTETEARCSQAAKKHRSLNLFPGFVGGGFCVFSGRFWPALGSGTGPKCNPKHSFLGTKYRPNRPNGDPIGGRFSFWHLDENISANCSSVFLFSTFHHFYDERP